MGNCICTGGKKKRKFHGGVVDGNLQIARDYPSNPRVITWIASSDFSSQPDPDESADVVGDGEGDGDVTTAREPAEPETDHIADADDRNVSVAVADIDMTVNDAAYMTAGCSMFEQDDGDGEGYVTATEQLDDLGSEEEELVENVEVTSPVRPNESMTGSSGAAAAPAPPFGTPYRHESLHRLQSDVEEESLEAKWTGAYDDRPIRPLPAQLQNLSPSCFESVTDKKTCRIKTKKLSRLLELRAVPEDQRLPQQDDQ